MIIDRLQEVLLHLQYLSPEAQEEIADHIKELEKELPEMAFDEEPWEDPAGSLSDLPDDTFDELDKIRRG